METTNTTAQLTSNEKTTSVLTHLSVFGQYIFPLANFILPIVIWSSTKKDSAYLDTQGKSVINFQLSLFLYTVIIGIVSIPVALFTAFKNVPFYNVFDSDEWFVNRFTETESIGVIILICVAVGLFFLIKIAEFFLVILGAVKAANGEVFKYPFCIKFIK